MNRSLTIVVVFSLVLVGCSDPGPLTAPISGVITYAGKPVQYANLIFFPQGVPGGRMALVQTDAEGQFSSDGALVGSHFVTVTEGWPPGEVVPVDQMGMEKSPPRGPWAQAYRDSANPKLKVDVVAGEDNHFEFDLSE